MATTPEEDLRQVIAGGNVLFVVGSGVSTGATERNPLASWKGLIKEGLAEAKKVAGVSQDMINIYSTLVDSGDQANLLAAAHFVNEKLGAPDGGDYKKWLRERVGGLRAKRKEVLEALKNLPVILATTNYDGLLEEVTGREAVTWRQGNEVERVLRGEDQGIVHLHGYWKDSASVILAPADYQRIVGDAHAQTTLSAIRSLKTLVFVGCHYGLLDPNFGRFLAWTRGVFKESESVHYLLASEGEADGIQGEHPREERLRVISYGGHDDLASFLERLRPGAPASSTPIHLASSAPAPAEPLPSSELCIGREALIEELVGALLQVDTPPIPILGSGGIGKSTLAIAALHDARVAKRFGPRRYFVRCDGCANADALVLETARTLGVELSAGANLRALVRAALTRGPAAVVLDNLETPLERDEQPTARLVAEWGDLPGVSLATTIRRKERPLGPRWREALELKPLAREHAREVFLAAAGVKFAKDPRLAQFLEKLDGVPLAIRLLGHLCQAEPDLEGLWEQWQDERTGLLKLEGGDSRHVNLAASYELSINSKRMTSEATRLLNVLALLPEGMTRDDQSALRSVATPKAARTLRSLTLAYDEADRLRMLAPLREHVVRRKPPNREALAVVVKHYLDVATTLGRKIGGEGGADASRRLAGERANLSAMVMSGLEFDDATPAFEAAVALARFSRFSGHGTLEFLTQARDEAHRRREGGYEAQCIESLGDIALGRSQHEEARKMYEEALPLYRRVGNVLGEANCIESLGHSALLCWQREEARKRYEEALPLHQRLGNVLGEANCIHSLGNIALQRLQHEEARKRYEEALPLYQRVGSVVGVANCIRSLGHIAFARSQHEEARKRYEEALPLHQRVGDVVGEANCVLRLGDIAFARSQPEEARARYQESLDLYQRIPEPYSIGLVHWQWARAVASGADRTHHLRAARDAWSSIDREDLIQKLVKEFGPFD